MFDWVLNTHQILKLHLPLTHLKIFVFFSSNSLWQSAANKNQLFAINAGNIAKSWFSLAADCNMYKHLKGNKRINEKGNIFLCNGNCFTKMIWINLFKASCLQLEMFVIWD